MEFAPTALASWEGLTSLGRASQLWPLRRSFMSMSEFPLAVSSSEPGLVLLCVPEILAH